MNQGSPTSGGLAAGACARAELSCALGVALQAAAPRFVVDGEVSATARPATAATLRVETRRGGFVGRANVPVLVEPSEGGCSLLSPWSCTPGDKALLRAPCRPACLYRTRSPRPGVHTLSASRYRTPSGRSRNSDEVVQDAVLVSPAAHSSNSPRTCSTSSRRRNRFARLGGRWGKRKPV